MAGMRQKITAKDTTIVALKIAFANRMINASKNQSLVIHSDIGIQYACYEY